MRGVPQPRVVVVVVVGVVVGVVVVVGEAPQLVAIEVEDLQIAEVDQLLGRGGEGRGGDPCWLVGWEGE